jgi:uncharacterized protein YjbI with pentapeptide repeats
VTGPPPLPRPPAVPEALRKPALERLDAEAVLEQVALGERDLSGARARGVAVRESRLDGTRLAAAELEGLELVDVELSGCDLANLRAGPRGGWIRIRAANCRMTGLEFTEGVLRDATLQDCRIDLASFGGARLQRVSFENCSLAQTDFLEAELDAVRFVGCDMTATDLRGARIHRCELRGSRLEGLRGVERLRGAAMPWVDIVGAAGLWAQALGIAVLDEDAEDRRAPGGPGRD